MAGRLETSDSDQDCAHRARNDDGIGSVRAAAKGAVLLVAVLATAIALSVWPSGAHAQTAQTPYHGALRPLLPASHETAVFDSRHSISRVDQPDNAYLRPGFRDGIEQEMESSYPLYLGEVHVFRYKEMTLWPVARSATSATTSPTARGRPALEPSMGRSGPRSLGRRPRD